MATGRAFRLADAFHPARLKKVVPLLEILHVERDVRQAHAIPGNRARRYLRFESEDLEYRAAGDTDPADLAAALFGINAEERTDTVGRRVRDPYEGAPEYLPVELHRAVEVRNGNAAVAERARFHSHSEGTRSRARSFADF